jgi:tRNA-modifying protein YgfZ
MFSHAEYEALQRGAGLLDRNARGRLHLTGGDRLAYLHGLLTNDILALSSGKGCYAALLTPQGRMVSDMRVAELGDRTLVDLPAATAGAVRQRLEDFIFSEDVTVTDVSSTQTQLGVYGPGAAEAIAGVLAASEAGRSATGLSALALNENAVAQFNGSAAVVVASDDYGRAGFDVFADVASAGDLLRELRARGAQDVSAETAAVTRVEAGRPEFGLDMDEHTIPLEAGIEDRAISLTKGCYVGQEIVIRVLHRGQGRVARRLVGFAAEDGSPLTRGDVLMAGDREAGLVTSAVMSPRLARAIGLGYVHRDFADPGQVLAIRAGDLPLNHVTVMKMPFIPPAGE